MDNICIWVNYALANGTSYGKIKAAVDCGLMPPPPELDPKKKIIEAPPGTKMKICAWCGEPLFIDVLSRNGHSRKYCCAECSRLAKLQRLRLKRNTNCLNGVRRTGRKKSIY